MKSGRVPRAARQLMNFIFLLSLLAVAGYFTWQASQEKVFEVPENHAVVHLHKPFFRLPWSKPTAKVVGPGKYPLTKGEDENVSCFPLRNQRFHFAGELDASSTANKFGTFFGVGKRSVFAVEGELVIEAEENSVSKMVAEGEGEYSGVVSTLLTAALQENVSSVAEVSTFAESSSSTITNQLKSQFGVSSAKISLTSVTATDKQASSVVKAELLPGQMVTAKIFEEMPERAYRVIIAVLVGTVFLYGFVRFFFEELFALILFFPLHALGLSTVEVHKAGYYPNTRRRRIVGNAADGLADVAGAAIDVASGVGNIASHHSPFDHLGEATDAIASGLDAAEAVGSAAEAAGGVLEAIGSVFDCLGNLF